LPGLPASFVDIGSVETFRDEDVDYATRLLHEELAGPTTDELERFRATIEHAIEHGPNTLRQGGTAAVRG
jgi:hypothetical protein